MYSSRIAFFQFRHYYKDVSIVSTASVAVPPSGSPSRLIHAMFGCISFSNFILLFLTYRLKVTYRHLFLHHIEPNQFADAAEYDAVRLQPGTCVTYQVNNNKLISV